MLLEKAVEFQGCPGEVGSHKYQEIELHKQGLIVPGRLGLQLGLEDVAEFHQVQQVGYCEFTLEVLIVLVPGDCELHLAKQRLN